MTQFLFKRSGTANKRPDPLQMALGEVDLNYNATTGGLFYKDSAGTLIKVGPAQVGANAPNATPAGSSGNAVGEFWYETVSGSLNIWDGTSWVSTTPGIGLASPASPGVVFGLSDIISLNVALGMNAGSNITTGTCNVALGSNVAVASATGSCQLAIGFSATANWLTGNSTKAIKPGAGIIDCAGSCGTVGQVLSSNGTNAIQWVAGGISPSTFTQCGDILVGTGAGSYVALAVPRRFFPTAGIIDGNALVSCGACTEGITWANPFISSASLVNSTAGALVVNGCDFGGSTCFTSILPGPAVAGQILTNAYNSGDPGFLSSQGYLNWCTPDYISQASFSPGALVVGCTPGNTGGICTVGSLVAGNNPGVAVGYYQGVTVSTCTGSGSGALASVNVINGGYFPILDSVEITQPGIGYALANQVGFVICGTTVTTTANVCSLNQSTICKAGYLSLGTNGQVLTADSTCALGVKWATTSGGTGIPCACITGQGALITGTAANLPTALSVGTAGQVLTVDLACSTGLKWATPSSVSAATPTVAGTLLGCSTTNITAVGCNALLSNTTGADNTAVGCGALRCNVSGSNNTVVGDNAGALLTGDGNTVLGTGTLVNNTGSNTTAIGQGALAATTGAGNTALGWNAGTGVTTGTNNVILGPVVSGLPPYTPFDGTASCQLAIGFGGNSYWLTGKNDKAIRPGAGVIDCAGSCGAAGQILMSNGSNAICWGTVPNATPLSAGILVGCTTSAFTAVGNCSLACLTTGSSNTAVGINALRCTTSGCCNAAFGINTLIFNTTGNSNVAFGNSALGNNTTGGCNTAVGHNALAGNSVNNSVAIGMFAMCRGTANGTTAIGTCALKSLTTGACNTAVGCGAMSCVTTGSENVAVGYCALLLGLGSRNVALGSDALINANGADNVAVGYGTLINTIGGSGNVAVGTSVFTTGTGSCNIGIGFQAACDVNFPTGCNNIVIGCCAATPTGGVSGSLNAASNRIVMGNSAHTCAQIQVAWSAVSDIRDKALDPAGVPYGLLFVEQLESIAYRFCNRETNEVTDEKLRYGFSAQNVRGLEGDIPVISNDDNPERLNITDSHLLPVLVNAIKELSDKNKLLEERIAALEDK